MTYAEELFPKTAPTIPREDPKYKITVRGCPYTTKTERHLIHVFLAIERLGINSASIVLKKKALMKKIIVSTLHGLAPGRRSYAKMQKTIF